MIKEWLDGKILVPRLEIGKKYCILRPNGTRHILECKDVMYNTHYDFGVWVNGGGWMYQVYAAFDCEQEVRMYSIFNMNGDDVDYRNPVEWYVPSHREYAWQIKYEFLPLCDKDGYPRWTPVMWNMYGLVRLDCPQDDVYYSKEKSKSFDVHTNGMENKETHYYDNKVFFRSNYDRLNSSAAFHPYF